LQAKQTDLEQKVEQLTEALAGETKRRESTEQRAGEIDRRRSDLEAELAGNKQAQAQLRQELGALQKHLRAEQESSYAEQTRLNARIEDSQATQAELENKVKQLTDALATETKRRECVEQESAENARHRTALEADLAQRKQVQTELLQELEALRRQLQTNQESSLAEQTRLEAQTQKLRATQAQMEQEVNRLTDALAEETERRKVAEQKVSEIGQRRSELDAELAKNHKTQALLRAGLEESKKQIEAQSRELERVNNELAAAQQRTEQESQQRQALAGRLDKVERAKAELASQADAAAALIKSHEDSIRSLDGRVQERQGEIGKLKSSLQSEIALRRKEQSEAELLAKQVAELNTQLAEKVAEQQVWHKRESELELRIRQQNDDLANSFAAASNQEMDLGRLRSMLDDMQIIQSALCAQVRELIALRDAASRRIHELDGQSQVSARTLQSRDQEIAALRHAILDAVRIGDNINRERRQVECQTVDGWKRMIATLLHTPLSVTQRGLLTEITGALENWNKARAEARNGVEFSVELPDLHQSEFDCAEVIECAFAAVRKTAEETGAKVQATLVGAAPECAQGNAQHIHQVITLLAASLSRLGGVENLELQTSFETKQNGTAGAVELHLSFDLSSTQDDQTLTKRLASITDASAALGAIQHEESELTLTSAWQLALAMGGYPVIETTADRKVRVRISLPLQAHSLSENGNGHTLEIQPASDSNRSNQAMAGEETFGSIVKLLS
jgi:chromosome segregation ATPase